MTGGHDAIAQGQVYPGLDLHPQSELARRKLRNTSGMIAFQAENALAVARRLAERLKVVKYAVSLGKPHSLVFYLPTEELQRTPLQFPPGLLERYRAWAGDGIFRLSVGLEAPEELIRDWIRRWPLERSCQGLLR